MSDPSACYCSEYQSSGIPCPPGTCPNEYTKVLRDRDAERAQKEAIEAELDLHKRALADYQTTCGELRRELEEAQGLLTYSELQMAGLRAENERLKIRPTTREAVATFLGDGDLTKQPTEAAPAPGYPTPHQHRVTWGQPEPAPRPPATTGEAPIGHWLARSWEHHELSVANRGIRDGSQLTHDDHAFIELWHAVRSLGEREGGGKS